MTSIFKENENQTQTPGDGSQDPHPNPNPQGEAYLNDLQEQSEIAVQRLQAAREDIMPQQAIN